MAQKWNLQDIVPPERDKSRSRASRRVSDMRPPTPVTQTTPAARVQPPVPEESESYDDGEVESLTIVNGKTSRMKRFALIAVVILFLGGIGFGITTLLRGAEVTVYPKNKVSAVQAIFTASQQPALGELGYELLSLEERGERRVTASGEEEVSLRAEGTMTIYNQYSTTPQRLIKNTRFESPDGLIYRIADSVVVPGYKKNADGSVTAGSVVANVFADGPGEAYNVGKRRFTIPGLKGSDQFDLMYGETSENGIQGGFEGVRFIIDENELATTRQQLQMELRDKLLARVVNEKPSGFVLYQPAITFTYESLPATEAGDKTATLKEVARLRVPLFEEARFASFIAENTIAGYEGEPVRLENPEALTFSYPNATEQDLSTAANITFNLSGSVRIIWTFDQDALKSALSKVAKNGLPEVLSKYPAIERAEAVVRPFWQQSFPENPEEIQITEVLATP